MKLEDNSIELFGTTYKIKFVDKIIDENDDELFGQTDPCQKVILIAKTINDVIVPKNEMEITLIHELIHAIFMTGQYIEQSDDEPLVEWTARCIYKLLNKGIL